MKKYDVYGIGNALMDFLIETDESQLDKLNLKKGNMHLTDESHSSKILEHVKTLGNIKIVPGGSSANTITSIAQLGGKVIFCGAVGNDENGNLYENKMKQDRINCKIAKTSNKTGHAITFITPDSQSTFATHLGSVVELEKEDIFVEDIKASKILHIEGYQLEDKNLKNVAIHAMNIAKRNTRLKYYDFQLIFISRIGVLLIASKPST